MIYPKYEPIGRAILETRFRKVTNDDGTFNVYEAKELAREYANIIFVDPFWGKSAEDLIYVALETLFKENPDFTRKDLFQMFMGHEEPFLNRIMRGEPTDGRAYLFAPNPTSTVVSMFCAIQSAFYSAIDIEREESV